MLNILRRRPGNPHRDMIDTFVASGLFDPAFYTSTYPDVGAIGEAPLDHFRSHGWREHRQASSAFDPVAYLSAHPDVASRGENAYEHFSRSGSPDAGRHLDTRDPSLTTSQDLRRTIAYGLFDEDVYRQQTKLGPEQDAMLHFLTVGIRKGASPSKSFDAHYYTRNNPDVIAEGFEPYHHYVRHGRDEGRPGSEHEALERFVAAGWFDLAFYLSNYPDVAGSGSDAREHFLAHGWREHRQSSAAFDPITYLAARPELVERGENAYEHFSRTGLRRSDIDASSPGGPLATTADLHRTLSLGLFDQPYYREAHPELSPDQDALVHFLTVGVSKWFDPSEKFDSVFYALDNADVTAAGFPPYLHYLRFGYAEGRKARCELPLKDLEALVTASGLFDEAYYRAHTPVVALTPADPIRHYLILGHKTFQRPSAGFDPIAYLATSSAARSSSLPALVHFLRHQPPAEVKLPIRGSGRTWEPGPGEAASPDQDLERERMRGIAFFAGFGFELDQDGQRRRAGLADQAIRVLAARRPPFVSKDVKPKVSIVIPVYGQLPYVLACLDSLSDHASRFTAEIIVVDDTSPSEDGTEALSAISWIRYDRRPGNGGFIATCNHGAAIAAGQFVVFLNSDTRLGLNWLDELIGTFDLHPKAGLVGSKLYNEDGTLQEAGAIYWRNGSAWNYGRGGPGGDPAYSFARPCDYCSGASIAIPRSVFLKVGGFDRRYAPAYCEDSDLAFTLRKRGYETWMQPLSRVIHFEGKSHGRDLSAGGKAYQVANMHRFAHKWAGVLAGHHQEGDQPAREANRGVTKRILIVDALTPTPDRDSGSVITFQVIRAFQELGWQVSFVPQSNYVYDYDYTDRLQRLGVECFYTPFVTRIDEVLDRSQSPPFDVVFAFRVDVLHPIIGTLRRRLPLARIVFHNVDLHYLREQRQAELFGNRSQRIKAARTQTEELEMVMRADAVIVHTPIERGIIEGQVSVRNIVEFPYIAEVHESAAPFDARTDVMFLGGFAHTPNIDAVTFFLDEVWPLLEPSLPLRARFVIVGDRPPPEVLSRSGGRVVVTGHVPELEPYFETARVFVAPLRYGAGIKGKVVQTLSHGVPSVCTPTAAEGMNLVDGEHALIAEDARSFAEAVLRLYEDSMLWHAIQAAGYAFVERNYSWQKCLELCTRVLDVADETWLNREAVRRTRRLERAQA